MKLNVSIALLLLHLVSFANKDSVIIRGTVTNKDSKAIKNALVHLVSSEGHRYEYKTDSTGRYRFYFYTESAFSCTVGVASDKWTSSGLRRNFGFLASKDEAVFELIPGKSYEKHFKLTEIVACETAIKLLFQLQSVTSCNDSLQKTDSIRYKNLDYAITDLAYMMLDDPGMIIEIQGHASAIEKDPDTLSLKRAEYIRGLIIAKGIHPGRITAKGLGAQKLLVSAAIIKKAKTNKEKMALHFMNQRAVFRITGWDFSEK